jgi:hypothetical protein
MTSKIDILIAIMVEHHCKKLNENDVWFNLLKNNYLELILFCNLLTSHKIYERCRIVQQQGLDI